MLVLAVERSGDRLTTTAHLHKQRAAVPEHVESGGAVLGLVQVLYNFIM